MTNNAYILTLNGWKKISEIIQGEAIWSLNLSTEKIEINEIEEIKSYDYIGEAYQFKNRLANDIVHPNELFPLHHRTDSNYILATADEIYNQSINDIAHMYIPKYSLEKIKEKEFNHEIIMEINGIKLKLDDYFDLIIYALLTARKVENVNAIVFLSPNKKYDETLDKLLFKATEEINKFDLLENTLYYVYDEKIYNFFKIYLSNPFECRIPREILNLEYEYLKYFYEKFTNLFLIKNTKSKVLRIYSNNMIHDLIELHFKIGNSCQVGKETITKHKFKQEHLVKKEELVNKTAFHIYPLKTNAFYLDKRFLKIEKININEKLYFIKTKNKTCFAMHNSKPHWMVADF